MNKHQKKTASTRMKIIVAAEPIFADLGLQAASMRQIAAAADVDLSLLLYHFQSKQNLYVAVISRALEMLSDVRQGLLDEIEARTSTPTPSDLFDAILTPWLNLHFGPEGYQARLLVNSLSDDLERERISGEIFDPATIRLLGMLEKAAPHMTKAEVHWGYHFFIGAMCHVVRATPRIEQVSHGVARVTVKKDVRAAMMRLVTQLFPNTGAKREDASLSTADSA